MNYPTTVLRPAEGAPERFVRADRSPLAGASGTAVACESPLVDSRTGAQLMMQRSYAGRGDYSVPAGRVRRRVRRAAARGLRRRLAGRDREGLIEIAGSRRAGRIIGMQPRAVCEASRSCCRGFSRLARSDRNRSIERTALT
jgi:hypothetical protein